MKLISAELAGEIWTAKVVNQDLTTRRVILNAGSKSGLQNGMELVVYHRSAGGVNPDTGEMISGDEVEVGRICIARLEGGAAFARVLTGAGFRAGDIVRLSETIASAR